MSATQATAVSVEAPEEAPGYTGAMRTFNWATVALLVCAYAAAWRARLWPAQLPR